MAFIGTVSGGIAGQDGVCRVGRENCGRAKGEFAEVMRGGVARRGGGSRGEKGVVEMKRECLRWKEKVGGAISFNFG